MLRAPGQLSEQHMPSIVQVTERGTTILDVPHFETGVVARVLPSRAGIQRLLVEVGGRERRAAAYPALVGPLAPGDRVVVNTTAVDLSLGTGGEDFVLWALGRTTAGT